MPLSRRQLIHHSALGAAGLGLAGGTVTSVLANPAPKRILILGGTGFIGPNTVRYSVERGHKVSIFTRGRREVDLPASVERLVGDRGSDLSALEGREWDAVLDNSSYDYRWVQKSTDLLADACEHYLLVSTLSVYAMPEVDFASASQPVMNALAVDAPLVPVPDDFEDGQEADYALMKVLCEKTVQSALPGRHTIVRPTLIVGPGDHTGRWSYWPMRFQDGGEILAPGNPAHSTQVIDQRDLSEWHVRLLENGTRGIFHGAGPASYLTMQSMLEQVGSSTDKAYSLTWAAEDFLAENGVNPWSDMPAWIPGYPIMYSDVSASVAAGLSYRPISDTAAATVRFEQSRPQGDERFRPFSLSREREQAVLKAWHSRNS